MDIIYAVIIIGILVLLFGFAVYLARSQNPKSQHYGTWSNVFPPQFRGSAFDVNERLNADIEAGRHLSRRARRPHRSRSQ
jgi:hypothetical protein